MTDEGKLTPMSEFTYRDLRAQLNGLSDGQLDQPVQLLPPMADFAKLQPVYGIDTLEDWGVEDSRGAFRWKHDPEAVVLLSDYHPYGPNGEVAYDLMTGEAIFEKGVGE